MTRKSDLERALDELTLVTGIRLKPELISDDGEKEFARKIQMLSKAYKTQYDVDFFLRNLVEGKLNDAEILEQSKNFNLDPDQKYLFFLIWDRESNQQLLNDVLHNISLAFPKQLHIQIDKNYQVILRPWCSNLHSEDSVEWAYTILDTINAEAMIPVAVSYSESGISLKEIQNNFREHLMAIRLSSIFEPDKSVVSASKVGIGRLITAIPTSVAASFVQETMGCKNPPKIEDELLHTMEVFFSNNLNIAETARKLYIHRNTLLYRMEQIKKKTGLDIREFNDALTCKLLIMIRTYLEKGDHNECQ